MGKKPEKLLYLLLLLCLLAGCRMEEAANEEADAYHIYYVNKEGTAVVSEGFTPVHTEGDAMVSEFVDALSQTPENPEYRCALPDTVKILSYTLENGQMFLYFDDGYQKLDRVTEVLCRAAIVRTVCQLPQVDYVSFFVNDQSLLDSNQIPVGLMNAELFIENAGEQINTYNSVTLDLYFANATGDKLVKERDNFNYSSNMSMEKVIVEQLIKGPVSDHAYPCIPSDTKLLSITTKDGICYVNLDDGFLGQGYDVSEAVPIYSIVNSLLELSNVNKVQILINGETPKVYRESISFETIFERNFDLIEIEEKTEAPESEDTGETEKESGKREEKEGKK